MVKTEKNLKLRKTGRIDLQIQTNPNNYVFYHKVFFSPTKNYTPSNNYTTDKLSSFFNQARVLTNKFK